MNNLESGSIAQKVGARAVSHLEYVMIVFNSVVIEFNQNNVLELNRWSFTANNPKHREAADTSCEPDETA